MKKILFFASIMVLSMALTACSSDDDADSIVGTWRTTYVDEYTISIAYTFKNNGQYHSTVSYRAEGLQTMVLTTSGTYTCSGKTLSMCEEKYTIYSDEAGGSSGVWNNNSEENMWTYPVSISSSSMTISNFKLSALYIGDLTLERGD